MKQNAVNERLLLPLVSQNSSPDPSINYVKYCKTATLIFVIFFVSGVLAFGLTVVFLNFTDENNVSLPGSASIRNVWIIAILGICGILALGLPTVIWRFCEKLEEDEIPSNNAAPTSPISIGSIPSSIVSPIDSIEAFRFPYKPPTRGVYIKRNYRCGKRIIGYYTENESFEITKNQLGKLTHAVFAFIKMNYDGGIEFKNEMTKKRFLTMKNKSMEVDKKLEVMISIGGEENSRYYFSVISDSAKKKTFFKSVCSFLKEHQIDGIDLFWKWPEDLEKSDYVKFMKEFRDSLNKQCIHYIISIAAPPTGISIWERGFDMNGLLEYVDFVNVFSMDYYGPWLNSWGNPAGPISPLYGGVGARKNFNVDYTVQYYLCQTKQPEKFNILVPFYVRIWENVESPLDIQSEVFRHVTLKHGKAEGEPYMSRWTVKKEGVKLTPATWDDESKISYIYDRYSKNYLVFETDQSLEAKIDYVKEKNLGGVWIWSVDMDDDRNSLLNSVWSKEFCMDESEE